MAGKEDRAQTLRLWLCVILRASSTTLLSTSVQNTCILNISAKVSIWLFAHSTKPSNSELGGTR